MEDLKAFHVKKILIWYLKYLFVVGKLYNFALLASYRICLF